MLALNGLGIGFLAAGPDQAAMNAAANLFAQLCVTANQAISQYSTPIPAGWTAEDQASGGGPNYSNEINGAIGAATSILWKLYQNQNTLKRASAGAPDKSGMASGIASRILSDFQGMTDSYQGTTKQTNYAAAMDMLNLIASGCAVVAAKAQQAKQMAMDFETAMKSAGRKVVQWYQLYQKIKSAAKSVASHFPSRKPVTQGPPRPKPRPNVPAQTSPGIPVYQGPPPGTPVAVTSGTCPDGTVIQFAQDYWYSGAAQQALLLAQQCPKPAPVAAPGPTGTIWDELTSYGNAAQAPASVGQQGGAINYGATFTPAPPPPPPKPQGPTISQPTPAYGNQPVFQGPPQPSLPASAWSYATVNGQLMMRSGPGSYLTPDQFAAMYKGSLQPSDGGIIGTMQKQQPQQAPINPGNAPAPQPNQGPQVPLQPFMPGDTGFDPNSLPGGAFGAGDTGPTSINAGEQFASNGGSQVSSDVMAAATGTNGLGRMGLQTPNYSATNKLLLLGGVAFLAWLILRPKRT